MHMYASVLGISVLLTIGFWNCSDSVVFFFHLNADVPHKSYRRAEIVFSNRK